MDVFRLCLECSYSGADGVVEPSGKVGQACGASLPGCGCRSPERVDGYFVSDAIAMFVSPGTAVVLWGIGIGPMT